MSIYKLETLTGTSWFIVKRGEIIMTDPEMQWMGHRLSKLRRIAANRKSWKLTRIH
jgi:hypothetical protein